MTVAVDLHVAARYRLVVSSIRDFQFPVATVKDTRDAISLCSDPFVVKRRAMYEDEW
jgi:hypothetical protein